MHLFRLISCCYCHSLTTCNCFVISYHVIYCHHYHKPQNSAITASGPTVVRAIISDAHQLRFPRCVLLHIIAQPDVIPQLTRLSNRPMHCPDHRLQLPLQITRPDIPITEKGNAPVQCIIHPAVERHHIHRKLV